MSNVPPPPPPGPLPGPGDRSWQAPAPGHHTPPASPGLGSSPPPEPRWGDASGAPPTPVAAPSASPLGHPAGILLGPLLAAIGVFLVSDAAGVLERRVMMLSDLEPQYLVELIAGAIALGAVLLIGRWSPLAPLTAGALLIVIGVLSHASIDFLRKMIDWWPTERGRFGWVDLLANGAWVVIGVVLVCGGVSHMIGRRQM